MDLGDPAIITLLTLKFIGILIALFAVVYFIYVGIKNGACSRKNSAFMFSDSLMYFFLVVFVWCKFFITIFEAKRLVIKQKINPTDGTRMWIEFGITLAYSICFLEGIWMFSFRYLVTSLELHNLFKIIDEETIKR